ncbi:MAG TPA: SRPBCC family protein, partial [Polyangiaceae bacterium]|nr:SRPBCC family protein [Polyangiaceae bacterium]
EWASPIVASCPVGDSPLSCGAVRECTIAAFGPVKPGTITERLVSFDGERMQLEYEALDGLPKFMERAVNRWRVVPLGTACAVVRVHASVRLGWSGWLLAPLLKWQLLAAGTRTLEELKHFVEQGQVHPRKGTAISQARSGSLAV